MQTSNNECEDTSNNEWIPLENNNNLVLFGITTSAPYIHYASMSIVHNNNLPRLSIGQKDLSYNYSLNNEERINLLCPKLTLSNLPLLQ